ncbi:hypothetical protein HY380_02165 [Candidatus Saccharibacteria bacterium]|nr:hypothetical protein [Candidatus Saccharibacteria bacterium]
MFDSNENQQPAAAAGQPAVAADAGVNPITGNETLGSPQISSPMPAIVSGAASAAAIIPKKKLLTDVPSPASDIPAPEPPAAAAPGDPDLLNVKQKALQDLTPLVSQLDLPPEEKFKTLMMLVQASNNSKLVKDAYDAASKITDAKARAQALLDIVNEVNYFTQSSKQ